ncbi:MAG TPA: ACP S-malonyltransferase [Oligoflexus sp.]|uniref:ACP S-malonyltransferase n=1 Tax=Oligoflexus sp. TaxID=1971216 RepID=UPI002D811078|nr:ACP S-malonyltransferase [Oligoflexus sp.]HET9241106.1 ACP S-malonyltransferase [Oligoflexus sp.]
MLTLMFPGQGSQKKGMARELFLQFPDQLAKANAILGYSLETLCLEDPSEELDRTLYTQPALYVVGALHWLHYLQKGGAIPQFVIGHSLGEYPALFAAGIITFEQGLRIVMERARLMDSIQDGGMLACLGIPMERLQACLARHRFESIVIANHNSPEQIILAGQRSELEALQALITEEKQGRAILLPVSGAFHSPLMEAARHHFLKFLETQTFQEPRITFIAQETHAPVEVSALPELLSLQLVHPLRWKECVETLMDRGVTQFLEMSEGRTLMRMLRQIRKGRAPEPASFKPALSLMECLEQKVAEDPSRVLFTFLQYEARERLAESLTAQELLQAAKSIAAVLQRKGLKKGDRVMIFGTNAKDNILSIYASIFAGAVFTLVPPPIDDAKQKFFRTVLDATQARFILSNTMIAERLDQKMTSGRLPRWMMRKLIKLVKGLEIINIDQCRDNERYWQRPDLSRDDLLYLQYSSGSTSAPKGVMVSHGQLMINAQSTAEANDQKLAGLKDYNYLFWAPIFHNTGLLGTFQVLFHPARVHLMSPLAFIEKPLRWFQAISDFEIHVTNAPNAVYDTCSLLIREKDMEGLRLDHWRIAGNGAEPAHLESMQRFARKFAPYGFQFSAFTVAYGLAESTCVVSVMADLDDEVYVDAQALQAGHFKKVTRQSPAAKNVVPVGKPLRGNRIAIIDPETKKLCAPGMVGEICVQGPSVAQGYWKDSVQTRESFGLSLEGLPGPFLRTGDLGVYEDGYLYVTGRQKELMIINGHNVYPVDIEQSIRKSVPYLDILRIISFAIPVDGQEKVIVCLEIPKGLIMDFQREVEAMRQALLKEFGFTAHDFVIIEDGGLPRTNTGKVQVLQSKKLYLSHEIKALFRALGQAVPQASATPPSLTPPTDDALMGQDIAEFLLKELSRVSQGQAFQLGTSLSDLALDSMTLNYLSAQISEQFSIENDPTVFFESRTLEDLVFNLARRRHPTQVPLAPSPMKPSEAPLAPDEAIAIIGMAGRFPGADSMEDFWKALVAGQDLIAEVPKERWDWQSLNAGEALRWGGFMRDVRAFDAAFFGITPGEARLMDPQQRMVLEAAWLALEHSGYRPSDLKSSPTAVFIGASTHDYAQLLQEQPERPHPLATTGNARAMLANRLSFVLNLHGPSETVDTACSSALVAVHRAVEALRRGECHLAIAGGVNVILAPDISLALNEAGMLSPEGRCKTFDQSASGYVRSEGIGLFILKPLKKAEADRDYIHAVIRSSAVNHGGRATSLTAPHTTAQSMLLVDAWRKAGIDTRSLHYLETHGTGTSLGDPIEVNAIKQAFRVTGEPAHCYLGAVKTQIGHLESAAGAAGLAKAVMALQHKLLPGNLHLKNANSYLGLAGGFLQLPNRTAPWESSGRRLAGVSSFGFGGSNAHIVLEEFATPQLQTVHHDRRWLFPFSGRSPEALTRRIQDFVAMLEDPRTRSWPLADLSANLIHGREEFEHRSSFSAQSHDELLSKLKAWNGQPTQETGEPGPSLYQKLPLPGYAFARNRYWFTDDIETKASSTSPQTVGRGDEFQSLLMALLEKRLGISAAHLHENTDFASLGLDSISGLQLLGDLNRQAGFNLKPKALMDHPNIKSLAEFLKQERKGSTAAASTSGTHASLEVLDIRLPSDPASLKSLFQLKTWEDIDRLLRIKPELQIHILIRIASGKRLELMVSGRGAPLFLLPALGLGHGQWASQVDTLAPNFRVIAVTLPGHGRSETLNDHSLSGMARALHELLDGMQIKERVHIVGSSFGGWVGRMFAQHYPERMANLVLVCSPVLTTLPSLLDFQAHVLAEREDMSPALQEQYENALVGLDLEAFAEFFAKDAEDAARPHGPVLLIAGRKDRIANWAEIVEWGRDLADAEVALLDDGGHFPNLSQSAKFHERLVRFLDRNKN